MMHVWSSEAAAHVLRPPGAPPCKLLRLLRAAVYARRVRGGCAAGGGYSLFPFPNVCKEKNEMHEPYCWLRRRRAELVGGAGLSDRACRRPATRARERRREGSSRGGSSRGGWSRVAAAEMGCGPGPGPVGTRSTVLAGAPSPREGGAAEEPRWSCEGRDEQMRGGRPEGENTSGPSWRALACWRAWWPKTLFRVRDASSRRGCQVAVGGAVR
jgi:hypothetical protein